MEPLGIKSISGAAVVRGASLAVMTFLMTFASLVVAQTNPSAVTATVVGTKVADRSVNDWLMRMHDASRQRAYVGTFVVSAGGRMSSARIWHACDGEQQMERVESLTGEPKSTYRRNDLVMTFFSHESGGGGREARVSGTFPEFTAVQ
jgi:sigma-E factor negative regulatory protein RseB